MISYFNTPGNQFTVDEIDNSYFVQLNWNVDVFDRQFFGNVVSGAGLTKSPLRRARVIDRHEHVHVWQARWFGPLYPLVYGAWTVLGAAFGVVAWGARGRDEQLWNVVDTTAYYSNPFEWWAYSREGRWPPPAANADLTWRRPIRVFRAGKSSA